MTDHKISGLSALTTPASGDLLPIVDIDDTSTPPAGAAGSDKAITVSGLTRTLFPSGDNTGVKDAAAITAAVSALPASGGTIRLAPTATWYIACGSVSIGQSGVFIDAAGCYISAVGQGDVFRMYDATAWNSRTTFPGGGILGMPVIDGTSTTGASCAFHGGDILKMAVFVHAQNFTQSSSIGVHLDNANFWTEMCYGRIFAQNCVQHVVFDVTGATTSADSFARANLDIYIEQGNATYDGVVLQNGAIVYDSTLAIRGNFVPSSSSLTSAVLRVTGTVPVGHPGAGIYAQLLYTQLTIAVELASGSFTPATIVCGSTSNVISGCYGVMDFSLGTGTFTGAGANAVQALYTYAGLIFGDDNLSVNSGWPQGHTWNAPGGLALGNFANSISLSNNSTIATAGLGATRVTSSGAVTGLILHAGTFDGQMLWVINTGSNSLTFAASGSNVADGSSDVIAANSSRLFIYDKQVTALWYKAS